MIGDFLIPLIIAGVISAFTVGYVLGAMYGYKAGRKVQIRRVERTPFQIEED